MTSLRNSARNRLARLRGTGAGTEQDAGFAMIFVLMITMLITVGVASGLVVTASNVIPAKQSQDNVAALAAARAGIEDYLAYLNGNCTTFNGSSCTGIDGTAVAGTVKGPDNNGKETYVRQVLNASTYLTQGFLRVKSTGKSASGTKTIVADIAGLPNVLRFAYLSKYETLAKKFVDSYYPARTVAIPDSGSQNALPPTVRASVASSGNTATWSAPTGTDICDRLWYDDSSANATDTAEANPLGAATDPAYQNPGRGTLKANYRTGLPAGTDWSQASNVGATSYEPCEVTFTTGMTFTGPVYSKDAVYMSYGTTGGAGPTFTIPAKETLPPVSTGWSAGSFPVPNTIYRSFPYIQGAPSAASTYADTNNTVQTSKYDLQLPTSVSDAATKDPTHTCIYTGPTRVVVTGATATIISPLTPANPANPCYANQNSGVSSSISPTGVTSAQITVSNTTIYVENGGTGPTGATGSAANPIFSLSTPASDTNPVPGAPTVTTPDSGYAPQTQVLGLPALRSTDGQWTLQWPSYSLLSALGGSCSGLIGGLLTATADLQFFNCQIPHATYPDAYSYVKHAVQAAVAANPPSTPAALATLINNIVSVGNTSDAANAVPDYNYNASHRYVVSAVADSGATDGCTPSTTTNQGSPSPVANPTSDKFLSLASQGYVYPQTQHAITCMTATVTLQVGTKTSALNSNGHCNANNGNCGWGDGQNGSNHIGPQYSLPQFKVTAKVDTPASYAHTTSTTVAFPNSQDITPYATWDAAKTNLPGDLYVEGTGISQKLSLVADHDIIVTGPLTTSYTSAPDASTGENSWTGGGAVSLAALNNVRIYHPVSCASGTASGGYCPNDITGLYTTALTNSDGTLDVRHPAMQYCNLTTGFSANTANSRCSSNGLTPTGTGAVSEIDAAVFALTGSLMTDNFNRGLPMGSSTVVGGIYQLHRGGTGQQWEIANSDTSRAYSGYELQDRYLAMQSAGLPYVPALKSGSSYRSWNIVSVSAGS